jgi:hypothetical protein
MMKRTGLLGVIVLAMLAACSKTPPPEKASVAEAARAAATKAAVTDGEQEAPPPAAPRTDAAPPAPAISPARKAAGLLALIDTAPQCQAFRTQLETAGQSPTSTGDELNTIVAKAGEAGCTKKPGTR